MRLSQAACAAMLANPWVGNIRQLQNVIFRAVTMTEGNIINVGTDHGVTCGSPRASASVSPRKRAGKRTPGPTWVRWRPAAASHCQPEAWLPATWPDCQSVSLRRYRALRMEPAMVLGGLAMLRVLQGAFVASFGAGKYSLGALVSLLVTVADIGLFNIGRSQFTFNPQISQPELALYLWFGEGAIDA